MAQMFQKPVKTLPRKMAYKSKYCKYAAKFCMTESPNTDHDASEYGIYVLSSMFSALSTQVRDEWSDSPTVELTPTYQFALGARRVLLTAPNQTLSLQAFIDRYRTEQGCELQPHNYGQTTVSSLVSSVPRVLTLVGRGAKRAITLNPCCLGEFSLQFIFTPCIKSLIRIKAALCHHF